MLTSSQSSRARWLFSLTVMVALLDLVGVASLMPFIAILANPEVLESDGMLKTLFTLSQQFGIETTEEFLSTSGIVVFTLLLASLAIKGLCVYQQLRFMLFLEYELGKRLLAGYLGQPYAWFLQRHSADLGGVILSEVNTVVNIAVDPAINIISKGLVIVTLTILLIVVDPWLTLGVGSGLAAAYTLIFVAARRKVTESAASRVLANQARFKSISEAFGAFKELKAEGLEQVFVNRFSVPAKDYAANQAMAQAISQLPRFGVEAIAFGGMLLVLLYLMAEKGGLVDALPIIAVYAYASYRLIPAIQQVYAGVTQLSSAGRSLDVLLADLKDVSHPCHDARNGEITLAHSITLKNIEYCYPDASQGILNGLNLCIPANQVVGVVGPSGSGKTTVIDIILGLLEPQKGALEVDGQLIRDHNRRLWQSMLGYVPQQTYLADDSVAANIAFGVEIGEINWAAVEDAARIAKIHEFVINELPQQYSTRIGERGTLLSGGQRQRLGIARALYRSPKLLVLDEATNALDKLTERAVMESICHGGRTMTVVLVTHSPTPLEFCHRVFMLDKGELKMTGSHS